MEKMEEDICLIINRDKVPVEEQPRFLRIIAEKCAAISLQMGLSIVSLVALLLPMIIYINSGSFSSIYFSRFSILAIVFSYAEMLILCFADKEAKFTDREDKINCKTIITLVFIYVYTFIVEVYLTDIHSLFNQYPLTIIVSGLSLFLVFLMYIWNERINEFLEKRLKPYQKSKNTNVETIQDVSNSTSLTMEGNLTIKADE